jgi:hypothetical protein
MAARRFLWLIVLLVILVLAGAFAYRLLGTQILRVVMVPTTAFEESVRPGEPDYGQAASWLARPGVDNSPAHWTPRGYTPAAAPAAAVFYVPPTSYLKRDRWNAPLDDPEAMRLLNLFARSQATVFNGVAEVWAPRYRQATFGAFLTDRGDAARAIDLAFSDVERAFRRFLAEVAPSRPVFLAGHSQGSLHLLRLLSQLPPDSPLRERLVAVNLAGWPVRADADLQAMGLAACRRADEVGCVLSWQSFAEPADTSGLIESFARARGWTRDDEQLVCTNPLLGRLASEAVPPERNRGMLVPNEELTDAALKPGVVGASCSTEGLLLIGDAPPGLDRFVLPGNNYHVYDFALFWANLRADVEARLASFEAAR